MRFDDKALRPINEMGNKFPTGRAVEPTRRGISSVRFSQWQWAEFKEIAMHTPSTRVIALSLAENPQNNSILSWQRCAIKETTLMTQYLKHPAIFGTWRDVII